MVKAAIIVSLLWFSACAAAPIYVPQRVEVPVYQTPPKITVPARPLLPVETLTPSATDAEVYQAWVQSVYILRDDDKGLRALLVPYGSR